MAQAEFRFESTVMEVDLSGNILHTWDLASIITAAMVAGFVLLAIAQVTAKRPVINLRLMLNRSYASVILIVVVIGVVLYGILYVLPQFLTLISGYNAEQSGKILFLSGIPAFLMMPMLPIILGKAPLKATVITGLICFAVSCFLDTDLTADSSARSCASCR